MGVAYGHATMRVGRRGRVSPAISARVNVSMHISHKRVLVNKEVVFSLFSMDVFEKCNSKVNAFTYLLNTMFAGSASDDGQHKRQRFRRRARTETPNSAPDLCGPELLLLHPIGARPRNG